MIHSYPSGGVDRKLRREISNRASQCQGTSSQLAESTTIHRQREEIFLSVVSTGSHVNMLYVRFPSSSIFLHLLINFRSNCLSILLRYTSLRLPSVTANGRSRRFFAEYTLDNRELTSGKDLEVAREVIGWGDPAKRFTKVTREKAIFLRLLLLMMVGCQPLPSDAS